MIVPMRNPTRADVAAEVRALLGRQDKSQRWLSEQTGIGAPGLSRRLKGERDFNLDELSSIATALGVPLSALLPERVAS